MNFSSFFESADASAEPVRVQEVMEAHVHLTPSPIIPPRTSVQFSPTPTTTAVAAPCAASPHCTQALSTVQEASTHGRFFSWLPSCGPGMWSSQACTVDGGDQCWYQCYYSSLPTATLCQWILPSVYDAPLVLHAALLFTVMEAVQAGCFYRRFRRSIKATEAALRKADQEAEQAEAEEAAAAGLEADAMDDHLNDEDSLADDRSSRGVSDLGTGRVGQVRLPRGSSRALRRLCGYWALVERAVRTAPLKAAGQATTAAALGRFFRGETKPCEASGRATPTAMGEEAAHALGGESADKPGCAGVGGCTYTSDGLPLGADKVLVLADTVAFPLRYPQLSTATSTSTNTTATSRTTGATASSSTDGLATRRGEGSPFFGPTAASVPPLHGAAGEAVMDHDALLSPFTSTCPAADIATPWQVLHALWTDTVRYSVNYTEIRQLLLSCTAAEMAHLYEEAEQNFSGSHTARGRAIDSLWRSLGCQSPLTSAEAVSGASEPPMDSPLPPSSVASSVYGPGSPGSGYASPRFADARVSVVSLALTWYLALIREVYDAVVIHEDVQRCADAMEELEEYHKAIYQRSIEPAGNFFEPAFTNATAAMDGFDETSASGSRSGRPRLLLPRVTSAPDAAVTAVPLPVSPSFADASPPSVGEAPTPPRRSQLQLPGSNPLSFDLASSPTLPFPPQQDRRGYQLRLRSACPRACWAELTAALAALLRRRRLMELACVRSLFCYMYTGSTAKMVSFSILAMLTSLSSRVAALGQATREAISSDLDAYYRNSNDGGGDGCGVDGVPEHQRVLALCLFECVRLAVNTVLANTANEFITLAASQRRNTVKAELYEALTRMPLAFFDLHAYDEVEQIVYYVNDIEGVEVHVHNYACGLITSFFAMRHAMHQLPWRARLLVGATVGASLCVKYIGRRVTSWTQNAKRTGGMLPPWLRGYGLDGTLTATAELDAQVEENMESNARQGGVMLRGLDIVAVLPQLRPYAADIGLMRWWTDHTRSCGAAAGATESTSLMDGLLAIPQQLYGKLLPAFGAALLTFADWVLPTLVSSYGASMAHRGVDALSFSNRLMEAMRCVDDMVDSLLDAHRVVEVVLLNAYKANVLERVLDRRWWEPTTMDYTHVDNMFTTESELEEEGEAARGGHTAHTANVPDKTIWGHSKKKTKNKNTSTLNNAIPPLPPHMLGVSFRRLSTLPPLRVRVYRYVTNTAYWVLSYTPPALFAWGVTSLVNGGMRQLGLLQKARRHPLKKSATVGGKIQKKTKQTRSKRDSGSRRSLHRADRRRTQTPPPALSLAAPAPDTPLHASPGSATNASLGVDTRASGAAGSVSDGNCTEAYYSDRPEGGFGLGEPSAPFSSDSVTSSNSSSSSEEESDHYFDSSEVDSVTAAVAAAQLLSHATVHAISIQNLQFYYPTAPTVPVFPRPITCSFALQTDEWLSPPLSSISSDSAEVGRFLPMTRARGRLVCLVGPSGHGKSTLLSLLLGMYTHYGQPCGTLHTAASTANAPGEAPLLMSDLEDDDAASRYGSPRLADTGDLPNLAPDILLTLRVPRVLSADSDDDVLINNSCGDSPSTARAPGRLDNDYIQEEIPVAAIPRDILRGHLFSFVPQTPVIFSGATIAHNISLQNYISLEQEELLAEIAQCAAWAHCEYIKRFPQGLMTYVADSGTGAWSSPMAAAAAASGGAGGGGGMVRLSGGQAQRLMMARAIFHGRRGGAVLIMDEPTASLDHEVKIEVMREWQELLDRGIVRGMVCATHDADLIDIADELVRLP